jgi:hypothetical protein
MATRNNADGTGKRPNRRRLRCERCPSREEVKVRDKDDGTGETETLCQACYEYHYEGHLQARRHLGSIAREV